MGEENRSIRRLDLIDKLVCCVCWVRSSAKRQRKLIDMQGALREVSNLRDNGTESMNGPKSEREVHPRTAD